MGDRLLWSVVASCGTCRNCLRDCPQKCQKRKKYGHHKIGADWQLSGGLAEFCHLIQGTQAIVVNEELSDLVLCPASCAIATVAAALRMAGSLRGARVLILGAGALGLSAAAMSSTQGAAVVEVCDTRSERLELATRFGADAAIDWQTLLAGNSDYDLILEMSGAPEAVELAVARVAFGGTVILVGSVRPERCITVDPEQLVRRVCSVHGVHNYRPDDLLAAVDFLLGYEQHFPFAEWTATTCQLDDVNRAIRENALHPAIRIAVRPHAVGN